MINVVAGSTITLSFNKKYLYIGHHSEAPGFVRLNAGYGQAYRDFNKYVLGFLKGDPDSPGQHPQTPDINPPLLQTEANGRRKMEGAKTLFITPAITDMTNRAGVGHTQYVEKIKRLKEMAIKELGSAAKAQHVAYMRPSEDAQSVPVQVAIEFSALEKHLRVTLRHGRDKVDGAYRAIDWDVANMKNWSSL